MSQNKYDQEEFENYDDTSSYYDNVRIPAGVDKIIAYLNQNMRVLDAGCGTGNYLVKISPHVKEIVGLEQNDGMFDKVSKKIQDNQIQNCTLIKHSLLKPLPFEDNSFDAVIINQVIHHLDNTPSFPNFRNLVKEVHRILKPNGFFSINHYFPENIPGYWFKALFPEMMKELAPRSICKPKLEAIFKEIGFKHEYVNEVTETLYGYTYWNFAMIFNPSFRKTDSSFALVKEEEKIRGLDNLKLMFQNGTFPQFLAECEKIRLQEGQTVFIFANKI